MRLDNSNNSLLCFEPPELRGAAGERFPGRQRAAGRRGRARSGGAARHQRRQIVRRGRLAAPRRDRPVEHLVEIEIGGFLDAVRRRIGPYADQPLGISAVRDQQAANALEKLERLDDDDVLDLAERVVAVDEIGQMPGEIGDDVATRFGRRRSAHGSNLSRFRRRRPVAAATRAAPRFRHYQPDRRVDKRARRRSRRQASALAAASRKERQAPRSRNHRSCGLRARQESVARLLRRPRNGLCL